MHSIFEKITQYEFILIYFVLLFFSGYYFFEYWTIPAFLILAFFILFRIKKARIIQKKVACVFFIMLFNLILSEGISSLLHRQYFTPLSLIVVEVLTIVIAFFVSILIDVDDFIDGYINCMTIIAIVSLAVFCVAYVKPDVINAFPTLINSSGNTGHFLIFSTYSDFSMAGAKRNQGIFWEPGAFQVFLNLAYILELIQKKRKSRKWILILFLISVFTTFSTTGIIVAILLLTFSMCRSKGTVNLIKSLIILLVIGIGLYYIIPKLTGFLEYTIVKKIDMVLNYKSGAVNDASSRVDSIIYPLKAFAKSPILGIGKAGFSALADEVGHSMFTCTPVNWFASYGVIFGILIVIGIWQFLNKYLPNKVETTIILLIFTLSVSSEALQMNVLMLAIVFWGYQGKMKHLNNNYSKVNERI